MSSQMLLKGVRYNRVFAVLSIPLPRNRTKKQASIMFIYRSRQVDVVA